MRRFIVSVDPGFGGTGIALFLDGALYDYVNMGCKEKDDLRYVFLPQNCADWVTQNIDDICSAIHKREGERRFNLDVVVEDPHAMSGVGGRASLLRGDVFKVSKLAGAIGALICYQAAGIKCTAYKIVGIGLHYPKVRTWKGQTKKDVTKRRVLRDVKLHQGAKIKLNDDEPSHIYDAIGLGLWFIKTEVEYEN